jgi:hypothetical protein
MSRRTTKKRAVEEPNAFEKPPERGPAVIVKKTFQEALVEGRNSISSFSRDFLDIDMYQQQANIFDEMLDASEATISAANRTGKSFAAGIWLLHRGFYQYIPARTRPEKLSGRNKFKIFATSLSQDQANLSWNYALSFAECPRFKPFLSDVVRSPFPEMTIRTKVSGDWSESIIGARSLSKGATYILGHSLAAILVDECAFVPNYETIEDLVLKMRLADWGGSILRISSPFGKANHLFRYFQRGQPGRDGKRDPRYYSATLATWDNPYIPKAYLKELKSSMSPELYAQNVGGQFIDLHDFFGSSVIQRLYDEISYPLPQEAKADAAYALGADLGALRDATVVMVFDITQRPYRLVYVRELTNASWEAVYNFVESVIQKYNPLLSVIDETGVGRPTVERLQQNNDRVEGFTFTGATKPDLLTRLQDAAQRRSFVFPFCSETRPIIDQLSLYRLNDRALTTDYVMSLALAIRAIERSAVINEMETDIDDDLLAIPVYRGGEGVPGDLLDEGSGVRFTVDPDTGLFLPRDETREGYIWDYLIGYGDGTR